MRQRKFIKRTRWTKELDAIIIDLVKQNLHINEISLKMDITELSARNRIIMLGSVPKGRGRHLAATTRARAGNIVHMDGERVNYV
jgi:hypothetical protein